MPSSFRAGAAWRIEGWKVGAKKNAIPASSRHRSTTSGGAVMLTPSASNRSALPQRLETERLPCLATRTPQAATHQRRDRGDVERVRAIAAGPARVEHRRVGARQLRRPVAHRPREADDLGGPLPFHAERDEKPGDLRRLRAPFHDLAHRGSGLVDAEVLPAVKLFEQRSKHHSSRKFFSS